MRKGPTFKTFTLLLAIVLAAGTASAGSASNAEVTDPKGDVTVQHLVSAGALEDANLSAEQARTFGDLRKAWVDRETPDSFSVSVQLTDIPDEWNRASPIVEVWTHFRIKDASYHAQAVLQPPEGGGQVQARYQLFEESNPTGELTGATSPAKDQVSFTVPKNDVREPTEGDQLTRFYVTTHLPATSALGGDRAVLDFAPGAEPFVVDENADPTQLELSPTVQYGAPYDFKDFTETNSQLAVQLSPSGLDVEAGQTARVAVTVLNNAPEADTAYLSVGNAPSGWSVRLDTAQLSVDPGASRIAYLTVGPDEDASGQRMITLRVTSELGADQVYPVSVTATQPQDTGSSGGPSAGTGGSGSGGSGASGASGGSGGQAGTAGGSSGSGTGQGSDAQPQQDGGNASEEGKGAPGPGALIVAAAAAGAAAWAARRRR